MASDPSSRRPASRRPHAGEIEMRPEDPRSAREALLDAAMDDLEDSAAPAYQALQQLARRGSGPAPSTARLDAVHRRLETARQSALAAAARTAGSGSDAASPAPHAGPEAESRAAAQAVTKTHIFVPPKGRAPQ